MSLSQREMEDLKGVLNETVKKFLGFSETSLVSAALNCLTKGYDKKKTVDKLSDLLDSGQATHFADKIYSVYEDYRSSSRHTKHKRKKDEVEEVKEVKVKKRRFMDDDEATTIPGPGTPSPGALTAEKIKEMMENARRELKERKAQLGIQSTAQPPPTASAAKPPAPAPPPPKPLLPNPEMQRQSSQQSQQSQQAMNDSVEKARRAAELQSQIQQRLLGLSMGLGGGGGGGGLGGMMMMPPMSGGGGGGGGAPPLVG